MFCKEFAKPPKKVSGAERKGICVAVLRVITEIGHILYLKEMDHQNPAPPPTHPGLPLATPIRSAWSIPTSLPNSLTNTLILYVHVSFHLFHMLFMPFTFVGRGCEMTPHTKNLLCFQAAWVDQEGNAEQPEVCGFSCSPGWTQPLGKVQWASPAGFHIRGAVPAKRAPFFLWAQEGKKTGCPLQDLWGDCGYGGLSAQTGNRKANAVWRRNKGKQCLVGKAALSCVYCLGS